MVCVIECKLLCSHSLCNHVRILVGKIHDELGRIDAKIIIGRKWIQMETFEGDIKIKVKVRERKALEKILEKILKCLHDIEVGK